MTAPHVAPQTWARLVDDGEAQIVVFPEGFEWPGAEVRLTRIGAAILMEPIDPDDVTATDGPGPVAG